MHVGTLFKNEQLEEGTFELVEWDKIPYHIICTIFARSVT